MKKILVSACLLGAACRYDGQSKPDEGVIALKDKYALIPVCPELLGGLSTPRIPCEIKGGRVINRAGEDKTSEYRKGAEEVLRLARLLDCNTAVLKKKSPSCGSGEIYDGSFSGVTVTGDGICAELLKKNGIKIINEEQIKELSGGRL
ncbi:MAG: DUF523 domain-containing protein [Acutalibacteraceae bacterium]